VPTQESRKKEQGHSKKSQNQAVSLTAAFKSAGKSGAANSMIRVVKSGAKVKVTGEEAEEEEKDEVKSVMTIRADDLVNKDEFYRR